MMRSPSALCGDSDDVLCEYKVSRCSNRNIPSKVRCANFHFCSFGTALYLHQLTLSQFKRASEVWSKSAPR